MIRVTFCLLSLLLCTKEVIAQTEPYSVEFEDITIMFPTEPTITGKNTYKENYISETERGIFTVTRKKEDSVILRVKDTVLIGRYDNPLIFVNRDAEIELDTFIKGMSELGDVSEIERVTKGEMQGRYFRFEGGATQQGESLIMLYLILMRKDSPIQYSISYQCWAAGDGKNMLYDKESFLALIKDK